MSICSVCKVNETLPPCSTGRKIYLCGECKKETHKKFYSDHKERRNEDTMKRMKKHKEFVEDLKKNPCEDCGNVFPTCCMDFDHVDPTTKVKNISRMLGSSKDKILEEIKKCQLVCANCHRIRTHENKLYRQRFENRIYNGDGTIK